MLRRRRERDRRWEVSTASMFPEMTRRCVLSPCGTYRYVLEEILPKGTGSLAWIMINPSTADGLLDDATIRKVRGFTERLGFGRWFVINLFAFRAVDIRDC